MSEKFEPYNPSLMGINQYLAPYRERVRTVTLDEVLEAKCGSPEQQVLLNRLRSTRDILTQALVAHINFLAQPELPAYSAQTAEEIDSFYKAGRIFHLDFSNGIYDPKQLKADCTKVLDNIPHNKLRYHGLSWTLIPYKKPFNAREVPHPTTDPKDVRVYDRAVTSALAYVITKLVAAVSDVVDTHPNVEEFEKLPEYQPVEVLYDRPYRPNVGQKQWSTTYKNKEISQPHRHIELLIEGFGRVRIPMDSEYSDGGKYEEAQIKAARSLIGISTHIARRYVETQPDEDRELIWRETFRQRSDHILWEAATTTIATTGLQTWRKHPVYSSPVEYAKAMVDSGQINFNAAVVVPDDIGDAGNIHGEWPTDVLDASGEIDLSYRHDMIAAKKDYWSYRTTTAMRRGICPASISDVRDNEGKKFPDTAANMFARTYLKLLEHYWNKK